MATIREITEDVLDEIQFEDLRLHESLVASQDPGLLQIQKLAQRTGQELASYGNPSGGWPPLLRTLTFQSVEQQGKYPVPRDLERVLTGTFWNVDRADRVHGPIEPTEAIERLVIRSQSSDEQFYMSGDDTGELVLRLVPTPRAVASYVLAYLSKSWLRRADGTLANRIATDDDEVLLQPEWLFSQGLKAHILRAKNLPTGLTELEAYQKARRKLFADQRGVRPVKTGRTFMLGGRRGNTVGSVPEVGTFGEHGP